MDEIKKLLEYLKDYDVETVMNYSSRRHHESLGKLIKNVEDWLVEQEYAIDSFDGIYKDYWKLGNQDVKI